MFNPRNGAVFDLSSRVKLRVSGQDRHRYLNGQITNDVGKASDSEAIAACVLNAKGKMDAHVFIRADETLRDTLQPRLERYVIADDVVLEDVTDNWSLFHVIGELPPIDCQVVAANRFGVAGRDVWIAPERKDEIDRTVASSLGVCDEACAETFRIEQGIPRWGRESTPDILPPEANLEESCIDYGKGCYIGQEVISRMKMSGQTSKRLCGLRVLTGTLTQFMQLLAEEKQVGWVTSATESERAGGKIGLAFIKRGANSPGSQLIGRNDSGAEARAVIVDLPFRPNGN
jgi:folate-binding protein YgfZ